MHMVMVGLQASVKSSLALNVLLEGLLPCHSLLFEAAKPLSIDRLLEATLELVADPKQGIA